MTQMRLSSADFTPQQEDGERRCLNSELWHACAGPLVSLPAVGSRVVYFPQGHSEQVANSTNREVDGQIPNHPSLPPQLICQLHDVIMHADVETDEVYAQMTLQPLSPQEQKEIYLPAELGVPCKQPTNYFCKTLTASDTSTHGGFSVPRRAAEKVFPQLDFSQQPPAQELIARDLHDNEWKFRHIFRGQPKRHLLTTGWSVFVSAKKLVAGDSVLFIWNENNQLLIGIRRANRPQTAMPSSVLSSDSMHLGLLAAAAHAAKTNSRFTIFYNPRASPTEFVIPLTKYGKAVYHTRVSVGMRFRMMFETEESSVRRYMGTITGISDMDPARWPNSHWRSVKVGWDESTAGERQPRVSLWEIEPLTTFPMYPSPFSLGLKRPWPSGIRDNLAMNRLNTWFHGDNSEHGMHALNFQGVGMSPYMQPRLDLSMLGLPMDMYQVMAGAALQDMRSIDPSRQAFSSHLQFQQPQVIPTSTIPNQVLPQSQPQHAFLQNPQGRQPQLQADAAISQSQSVSFLQQQLQHSGMLNSLQSKQHQLLHQQQHHVVDHHSQITNLVSSMPQFASSLPQVHLTPPSLSHQRQFSEFSENPISSTVNSTAQSGQAVFCSPLEGVSSNLLNVTKTDSMVSSPAWLHKRAKVEPPLPPEAPQNSLPRVEFVNSSLPNNPEDAFSLPPFPDHDGAAGLQNNLMFGVNLDSSPLFMQNRLRTGNDDNLQFPSSNLMGSSAADYAVHSLGTASSCNNGSELLHSPDNMGDEPPKRNFVKIHKSGSCGRSLDLANFSNYQELRSELARMFGLEGLLEDPLRSGWQLVFIDKENDILLVGDDPWMEFVNSVSCIKILPPGEIPHTDPHGLELLSSVPFQKLSNSICEDYSSIQDPRNMNAGIPCVGSLEY